MKNYVGIDLGTTNSAICTFDGQNTRIWKSQEQNDVTPSAIYIHPRGNKYVGKRAYDMAPLSPGNAAILFKRLMGTSTPVNLPGAKVTMTAEECSAEILRALMGYLPEELRGDPDIGTVITVPAAFNQMKKNATMEAAERADIGRVALMQEPVAAVMSVTKTESRNGIFVIYDLGGGTLDVAVAEMLEGRINLLAHGGIEMCGGRDFDRLLVDNVVKPWLFSEFDLPDNVSSSPKYRKLVRLCAWAAEKAKIDLSALPESSIWVEEMTMGVRDESGTEIYLDVPVTRNQLDSLMAEKVDDSIEATRATLEKAGLSAHDLERIVFIGGPTHYKPLRDRVAAALGLPASTEVNPMTAVAEGASIFAESIDWKSASRKRKSSRGAVSSSGPLNVEFVYNARTPDSRARIIAKTTGTVAQGADFQVDSMDVGWSSGRIPLEDGASVEVGLTKSGANRFAVSVFAPVQGGVPRIEKHEITITRTAAQVDAIPASHSIGIEVKDKRSDRSAIVWLVREGDELPKAGTETFKAGKTIRAGSGDSLNFRILEGESDEPEYNLLIGVFQITGSDFDDGHLWAGSELECEYEFDDGGYFQLDVSIPSLGATFSSDRNYYSRQEGQLDYTTDCERIHEQAKVVMERLSAISASIDDPRLDEASDRLDPVLMLEPDETDKDSVGHAVQNVQQAQRLVAEVRKANRKQIRLLELREKVAYFNDHLREHARDSEKTTFDNLVGTAERSIERNDAEFDRCLGDINRISFEILWRQDSFVIAQFKYMASSPYNFTDIHKHAELVRKGIAHLESEDIGALRAVIRELWGLRIEQISARDLMEHANIHRA